VTTIRVPIGPAVDAVQRVSLIALGEGVECNYPVWQIQQGETWSTVELDAATHAAWDDHRFSAMDVALANAIAAAPDRVPLDTTALDRAAVLALYPEAVVPEVTP
jgi:hypothetical protein